MTDPCCTRPDETATRVESDGDNNALNMLTECRNCGAVNKHVYTFERSVYDTWERNGDDDD